MARYRIDHIAELARQMAFTPQEVRLGQINAAEELLHDVDPARAYPPEFLTFRITGYRPKTHCDEMLAGEAVQHDLGLLIEQISDTLDVRTDSLAQPVLSIDDVTERFNVTSKTIQRWRRKGLPARRFVFPDGKRRVGFLLASVERFVNGHREQVAQQTNFSQVGQAERDVIIRRARRLGSECRCCSREIARRIARKLGRSPLTILHTIRKFDQEHPAEAVFPQAPPQISDLERQRILRGQRRGMSISLLAPRMNRPRSAIYRVVLDERIERINRRKTRFIDDPLYHHDDAAEVIDQIVEQEEISTPARPEDNRIPRDLPPYLQDLYRTPLLSPARERALFLKFNFHKFQFVQARRQLEPQFAKLRDLQLLEGHLRSANETKNAILRANLRLVVSVARKHLRAGISLMELISDGNITLMRAVEGFDIHRGHRFSTYATLALMKGFARSVPQMLAAKRTTSIADHMLESVPDRAERLATDRLADREQVEMLLSRLSDCERHVLSAHYGLDRASAVTLDEVGEQLGLSKHRVRQIEKSAFAKLRKTAGPG